MGCDRDYEVRLVGGDFWSGCVEPVCCVMIRDLYRYLMIYMSTSFATVETIFHSLRPLLLDFILWAESATLFFPSLWCSMFTAMVVLSCPVPSRTACIRFLLSVHRHHHAPFLQLFLRILFYHLPCRLRSFCLFFPRRPWSFSCVSVRGFGA